MLIIESAEQSPRLIHTATEIRYGAGRCRLAYVPAIGGNNMAMKPRKKSAHDMLGVLVYSVRSESG